MNTKNNNFLIKSIGFEGPFDKLLELIEKKKLSVNDVSLSKITDEYIGFLKENELKLGDTTKFIWVASILILLKSKSLLPKISFNQEDEGDIDELKIRLMVLSEFRKASQNIKNIFGKNIAHRKIFKKNIEIKFRPDKNINFKNILLSMDALIARQEIEEKIPEQKVQKQKSLREITEEITKKIERYIKLTFSELVLTSDRKETSASFISILELFRNGFVDLEQKKDFGEIMIEKKDPGSVLHRE